MLYVLILTSLLVGLLGTSIYISPRGEESADKMEELIIEDISIDFIFIFNWKTVVISIVNFVLSIIVLRDSGIYFALMLSVFILMSVWDLRFKLVPNSPIFILLLLALLELSTRDISHQELFSNIFLAIGTLFVLVILGTVLNGKIGGADIKLFSVLAITFNIDYLFLIFYLTFLIGSLFVFPLYLIKKTKSFALIPYICIAFLITTLSGTEIIDWYLSGGLYNLF